MNNEDNFNLQRFIEVQNPLTTQAEKELKQGVKQSHWMWYFFPQIQGLGFSHTTRYYSLGSLKEAKAYIQHPVLGSRLRRMTEMVLTHKDKSVKEIFTYPDNLKFHSSMTLFMLATEDNTLFSEALDHFFKGKDDGTTREIVSEEL